ncbi:hypothetical protein DYB32_003700 [Aphanomyces invadans]|uniref:IPT/TIG domain-containing protein n=1 Tax=Aphanomyces invadans TaxID=157072 RepID=A0A3R6VNI5_9STRA|nr:hypothetical protein DYB32_003700 [Aphanomyces invadans]
MHLPLSATSDAKISLFLNNRYAMSYILTTPELPKTTHSDSLPSHRVDEDLSPRLKAAPLVHLTSLPVFVRVSYVSDKTKTSVQVIRAATWNASSAVNGELMLEFDPPRAAIGFTATRCYRKLKRFEPEDTDTPAQVVYGEPDMDQAGVILCTSPGFDTKSSLLFHVFVSISLDGVKFHGRLPFTYFGQYTVRSLSMHHGPNSGGTHVQIRMNHPVPANLPIAVKFTSKGSSHVFSSVVGRMDHGQDACVISCTTPPWPSIDTVHLTKVQVSLNQGVDYIPPDDPTSNSVKFRTALDVDDSFLLFLFYTPPQINYIWPTSSSQEGGGVLRLKGLHLVDHGGTVSVVFSAGATHRKVRGFIELDPTRHSDVFGDSLTLMCCAPSFALGCCDIYVSLNDQQYTKCSFQNILVPTRNQFLFFKAPAIVAVSPICSPSQVGSTVVIQGVEFIDTGSIQVRFTYTKPDSDRGILSSRFHRVTSSALDTRQVAQFVEGKLDANGAIVCQTPVLKIVQSVVYSRLDLSLNSCEYTDIGIPFVFYRQHRMTRVEPAGMALQLCTTQRVYLQPEIVSDRIKVRLKVRWEAIRHGTAHIGASRSSSYIDWECPPLASVVSSPSQLIQVQVEVALNGQHFLEETFNEIRESVGYTTQVQVTRTLVATFISPEQIVVECPSAADFSPPLATDATVGEGAAVDFAPSQTATTSPVKRGSSKRRVAVGGWKVIPISLELATRHDQFSPLPFGSQFYFPPTTLSAEPLAGFTSGGTVVSLKVDPMQVHYMQLIEDQIPLLFGDVYVCGSRRDNEISCVVPPLPPGNHLMSMALNQQAFQPVKIGGFPVHFEAFPPPLVACPDTAHSTVHFGPVCGGTPMEIQGHGFVATGVTLVMFEFPGKEYVVEGKFVTPEIVTCLTPRVDQIGRAKVLVSCNGQQYSHHDSLSFEFHAATTLALDFKCAHSGSIRGGTVIQFHVSNGLPVDLALVRAVVNVVDPISGRGQRVTAEFDPVTRAIWFATPAWPQPAHVHFYLSLNNCVFFVATNVTFLYYTPPPPIRRISPAAGPITGQTWVVVECPGAIDTGEVAFRLTSRDDVPPVVVPAVFAPDGTLGFISPPVDGPHVVSIEISLNGLDYPTVVRSSTSSLTKHCADFGAPIQVQIIPWHGRNPIVMTGSVVLMNDSTMPGGVDCDKETGRGTITCLLTQGSVEAGYYRVEFSLNGQQYTESDYPDPRHMSPLAVHKIRPLFPFRVFAPPFFLATTIGATSGGSRVLACGSNRFIKMLLRTDCKCHIQFTPTFASTTDITMTMVKHLKLFVRSVDSSLVHMAKEKFHCYDSPTITEVVPSCGPLTGGSILTVQAVDPDHPFLDVLVDFSLNGGEQFLPRSAPFRFYTPLTCTNLTFGPLHVPQTNLDLLAGLHTTSHRLRQLVLTGFEAPALYDSKCAGIKFESITDDTAHELLLPCSMNVDVVDSGAFDVDATDWEGGQVVLTVHLNDNYNTFRRVVRDMDVPTQVVLVKKPSSSHRLCAVGCFDLVDAAGNVAWTAGPKTANDVDIEALSATATTDDDDVAHQGVWYFIRSTPVKVRGVGFVETHAIQVRFGTPTHVVDVPGHIRLRQFLDVAVVGLSVAGRTYSENSFVFSLLVQYNDDDPVATGCRRMLYHLKKDLGTVLWNETLQFEVLGHAKTVMLTLRAASDVGDLDEGAKMRSKTFVHLDNSDRSNALKRTVELTATLNSPLQDTEMIVAQTPPLPQACSLSVQITCGQYMWHQERADDNVQFHVYELPRLTQLKPPFIPYTTGGTVSIRGQGFFNSGMISVRAAFLSPAFDFDHDQDGAAILSCHAVIQSKLDSLLVHEDKMVELPVAFVSTTELRCDVPPKLQSRNAVFCVSFDRHTYTPLTVAALLRMFDMSDVVPSGGHSFLTLHGTNLSLCQLVDHPPVIRFSMFRNQKLIERSFVHGELHGGILHCYTPPCRLGLDKLHVMVPVATPQLLSGTSKDDPNVPKLWIRNSGLFVTVLRARNLKLPSNGSTGSNQALCPVVLLSLENQRLRSATKDYSCNPVITVEHEVKSMRNEVLGTITFPLRDVHHTVLIPRQVLHDIAEKDRDGGTDATAALSPAQPSATSRGEIELFIHFEPMVLKRESSVRESTLRGKLRSVMKKTMHAEAIAKYYVQPLPVIESIAPKCIPSRGGSKLSIHGHNFVDTKCIRIAFLWHYAALKQSFRVETDVFASVRGRIYCAGFDGGIHSIFLPPVHDTSSTNVAMTADDMWNAFQVKELAAMPELPQNEWKVFETPVVHTIQSANATYTTKLIFRGENFGSVDNPKAKFVHVPRKGSQDIKLDDAIATLSVMSSMQMECWAPDFPPVSPSDGPIWGGTTLTIRGANFVATDTLSVRFTLLQFITCPKTQQSKWQVVPDDDHCVMVRAGFDSTEVLTCVTPSMPSEGYVGVVDNLPEILRDLAAKPTARVNVTTTSSPTDADDDASTNPETELYIPPNIVWPEAVFADGGATSYDIVSLPTR